MARTLARQRRFDIIQVRNELAGSLVAMGLRRKWNMPFVYQLSFPVAEAPLWEPGWGGAAPSWGAHARALSGRALQRWVMRRADLVLAISDGMREQLIAEGLRSEKVATFPLGLDTDIRPEEYDPAAIRRRLSIEGRPVILFLGAMDRLRRLDFLFHVLVRVLEAVPDAILLMVGKAERDADVAWLKAEANRMGVHQAVRFIGAVPRADVPQFLAAAHVVVSPYPPTPVDVTRSPTKVLESPGMARPVVVNREVGDQDMLVGGSGGGICVPYDIGAFAGALMYLLAHPAEAAAAGRKGRDFVLAHRSYRQFAADIVAQYEALIRRACRKGE